MKNLYKYLFERECMIFEGAFSDAPLDVKQCRDYFDVHFAKGQKIPTDFIDYIYGLWEDSFDKNPGMIPFRCNGKAAKLARAYEVHKNDILDFCKNIKCPASSNDTSININGVTITWGDGSLKGVRAQKGLSYEDTVVSQICELVQTIAGQHKGGKLSKADYDKVVENSDLKHWYAMYDKGGLDELLDMYIKDPTLDLTTVVKKTGTESTHRNDHGELFDKKFTINQNDIEKVLNDSGAIIADVTIYTKTPQYISVKMKSSQLSGVNFQAAMVRNETFKKSVTGHENYDEIKNDEEMIAFNNLCTTLGLVPQNVYSKYKELYHGGIQNLNLELNKKFDSSLLGCLFQKLLGGNYWYVKPGICEYVDYKDAKLKVNINSASISDSGKGIEVKGDIKGIKCGIQFRTDGKGPWPYRLFPKISVPELIKKV